MEKKLSLHFHGYQPGDIVGRIKGPPDKPMRFITRNSPVGIEIDSELVKGKNWTDAVIGSYPRMGKLLGSFGKKISSVDIEPFTLYLLHRSDPASFREFMELFTSRKIDPVATCIFHPILPHMDPAEQDVLLRTSHLFYDTLDPKPVRGFWFPECVYDHRTAETLVSRSGRDTYLILDSRQYIRPRERWAHWSLNFIPLGKKKVRVFGRDLWLSDAFAFGDVPVHTMVDNLVDGYNDREKEERAIPYTITMASDLESLLASPSQEARLRALVTIMDELGIELTTHADFITAKEDGRFASFEGEGSAEGFRVEIKDLSSWSDYFEWAQPHTSDTRWTGLRRSDGNVISRSYRNREVSQIWKQALWHTTLAVNRFVSRAAMKEIRRLTHSTPEQVERFLSEYIFVLFGEMFRELDRAPPDLGEIAASTLERVDDIGPLALLSRAYHEMLMGNRSCARFWENMDTRVTFQNVVFLTHSLCDLMEHFREQGDDGMVKRTFKLLRTRLTEFSSSYFVFNLQSLSGEKGWESTENAWTRSIQSEIPDLSVYDVVKRATLYTIIRELDEELYEELIFNPEQVRADTGHIPGEMHGRWENPNWCEHHI